jgi:hypothetical protein
VRVRLQRYGRARILFFWARGEGSLGSSRYCVITIDAVRVSGIVTDETRLVNGG